MVTTVSPWAMAPISCATVIVTVASPAATRRNPFGVTPISGADACTPGAPTAWSVTLAVAVANGFVASRSTTPDTAAT